MTSCRMLTDRGKKKSWVYGSALLVKLLVKVGGMVDVAVATAVASKRGIV
jgi:hypothetical protein